MASTAFTLVSEIPPDGRREAGGRQQGSGGEQQCRGKDQWQQSGCHRDRRTASREAEAGLCVVAFQEAGPHDPAMNTAGETAADAGIQARARTDSFLAAISAMTVRSSSLIDLHLLLRSFQFLVRGLQFFVD